jgi:type VI secretion system protein ImpC
MTEAEGKPKGGVASFAVGFGPGSTAGKDEEPQAAPERSVFVVLVVAELSGRAEYSTRGARGARSIPIDKGSFDAVMAELAPSLVVELPEPWSGKPQRVDLHFANLKDFRPAELVEKVAPLRSAMEAKRVILRLSRRELDAEGARRELSRLLPAGARRDALLRELTAAAPRGTSAAPGPKVEAGGSALDRLLDQVDLGPAAAPAASSGGAASLPAPALVDAPLVELLSAVIEHPEVKRLEAAWRSLATFVKDASAAGVELYVVDAAISDESLEAVRPLASGRSGVSPDLLVLDHEFASTAHDADLLERWASLGAELMAPVLACAAPSLLGAGSLEQLARAERSWAAETNPQALRLRALSAKDVARWLGLAVNGTLLRPAWDAASARLRELPIAALGSEVWQRPCYALAALAARSFVQLGFGSALIGPEHGILRDRPVRIVSDRGHDAALPVEVFVSTEAQSEIGKAGVIALGSARNHDAVIVSTAPVVYRGDAVLTGANVAAELGLGDQLFVGRFARAVEQLAGALPAGVDPVRGRQVAELVLGEQFRAAPPAGPELEIAIAGDRIEVTVRPRRYAQVRLPEITLGARLSG